MTRELSWSRKTPTVDGVYLYKALRQPRAATGIRVVIRDGMATTRGVPRPVVAAELPGWWAKEPTD